MESIYLYNQCKLKDHEPSKFLWPFFSGAYSNKFVFQIVCEKKDVVATGCAVARALPLYQGKSASVSPQKVTVQFLLANEDSQTPLSQSELDCLTAQAHGIRLSAKIVDIPCNIMHTNTFLEVMI